MNLQPKGPRERLLQTCLVAKNKRLAGGAWANNVLDIERLNIEPKQADLPEFRDRRDTRDMVVSLLGAIAIRLDAEFVVGVPNGANWLAETVAKEMRKTEQPVNIVRLHKKPNGEIIYGTDLDAVVDWDKRRGVLIEDVITTGGSFERILNHPLFGRGIIAGAAVWVRGQPGHKRQFNIPLESIVEEHIPIQLPIDSSLWQYSQPRLWLEKEASSL